ncbi:MAG: cysteine peptidase family C39 domain-containing protein [Planctomycetota bacterium]
MRPAPFALFALALLSTGCAADRFDRARAASDSGLLLLESVRPIRQSSETDCGPACLSMALQPLGVDAPPGEIAKWAATTERGVSVETLSEAARSFGAEAFYFQGEPDESAPRGLLNRLKLGRPVIVGLAKPAPFPSRETLQHFEVVVGRWPAEARWILADPATGSLRAPPDADFLPAWNALKRVSIVVIPETAPGSAPPRNPPDP